MTQPKPPREIREVLNRRKRHINRPERAASPRTGKHLDQQTRTKGLIKRMKLDDVH